MNERNPDIIHRLRTMAREGATVPQMLRDLIRNLGQDAPHVLTLAKFFREAFALTLLDVKPLGGWSADGKGEFSDSQVNEFILPEIRRHRHEWDQLVRN